MVLKLPAQTAARPDRRDRICAGSAPVIVPGLATRPVDFRRGHDGLAATVQNELGLNPHSGVTVVFRSKRGDRVKILVWDDTSLVLTYKRLESGQFTWPQIRDGVMRLSRAQFEALFEDLDWRRVSVPLVQVPAAAG
ncbi:MAG: IS66 family insertion sequence element accessory protein TnpB [Xanthobacteraceae bacterium]